MLIIVATVAAPTEADILEEIERLQRMQERLPEDQRIYNPDLLREKATSNLLQGVVTVEGDQPYVSEKGTTFEVEPPQQEVPVSPTEAPAAEAPPEISGNVAQQAQQLYVWYNQTANKVARNEVINRILLLPYANMTLGEWMSEEVIKAEERGLSKGIDEWIYGALETPNVKNFLAYLTSMSKYFKPEVPKSKQQFQSYIDQNGNPVPAMIPRHLRSGGDESAKSKSNFKSYFDESGNVVEQMIPQYLTEGSQVSPSELLFRMAKSRITAPEGGKAAFRNAQYLRKDISNKLNRFDSLEQVETTSGSDARLIEQYLEDLMVAEAFKWNRWEYKGQYQDFTQGFTPPGNEGSRTYSAFENLNRVYALAAPHLGLPTKMSPKEYKRRTTYTVKSDDDPRLVLQVQPIEIADPRDPTLSRKTRTFRTEKKSTLGTLAVMMNNFVRGALAKLPQEELDRVQNLVNSSLPPEQHISLQKKDYQHGGKFFVEDRMVSTSKQELGPSYVREQRERAAGQGRKLSLDVSGIGAEGEPTQYEVSKEDVRGTPVPERPVWKPRWSTLPINFAKGPMGPSMAKEIFGEDDPTWRLVDEIQARTEELRKTLPTTPASPRDALVYPIRPTTTEMPKSLRPTTSGKSLHETPEEIARGEDDMRHKLSEAMGLDIQAQIKEDPIERIKKLLESHILNVKFDVRPVQGRYLFIKPLGTYDPEDEKKPIEPIEDPDKLHDILISASKIVDLHTHDKLPKMTDQMGQKLTASPNLMADVIRGYLFATRPVQDLTEKPLSYRRQYDTFVADQAFMLAREEIADRNPEYAEKLSKFYTQVQHGDILPKLRSSNARGQLLGRAATKLYGKELPLEKLAEQWNNIPDESKVNGLKNFAGHNVARFLSSTKSLDKIINEIYKQMSLRASFEKALVSRLSQAELRSGAGFKESVYKLVSDVLGEMIGLLIRENLGATKEDVQATISLLRMVRLAITGRMMTKVG